VVDRAEPLEAAVVTAIVRQNFWLPAVQKYQVSRPVF
jgi:hypothetical protein